ncbi:family 20 glycosylhydrolase [Xylanimonas sp. McL0601]|uniref:family 20 glycosylhydrolase n=1 Tax=Xylanimonas sp. McL0601 TaxID=3414739 RepID=UPI003CEC32DE
MNAAFPLVPWPTAVEPRDGELAFPAAHVVSPEPLRWTLLAAELLTPLGVSVTGGGPEALAEGAPAPDGVVVELRLEDSADRSAGGEAYVLDVRDDGITVTAPEPAGLLHGLRTLRQLVTPRATVPTVVVRDAPRYPWRGLTLDIARHWFGPAVLRRVVDLAGSYKLRVLHLHLTDDQGWRLEIPSRPGLTERSGRTQVGGEVPPGERGWLTVEEYRELQDYAAARFVEVVPEVDLPGHTNAATHAYGELRPDGLPTPLYGGIEVGFSQLWADNPATEPFVRDVLGDVAAMTAGRYVHVGGDEALTLEAGEYARLVGLALDAVRAAGKTPAAWQEAATAAVEPGTVLQFWDPRADAAPLLRAAAAGARFIMSPASHAYCDMKYDADHPIGQDWMGLVELRDAYGWEPSTALPGLPPEAVEGVAAALWTETIVTTDHLFSMLLPRLPALAEVAWTPPSGRDWASFRARVAEHARTWDAEGWAYHPTRQVAWP